MAMSQSRMVKAGVVLILIRTPACAGGRSLSWQHASGFSLCMKHRVAPQSAGDRGQCLPHSHTARHATTMPSTHHAVTLQRHLPTTATRLRATSNATPPYYHASLQARHRPGKCWQLGKRASLLCHRLSFEKTQR